MSPNIYKMRSNDENNKMITAEDARRNAESCRNVVAKNPLLEE